MKRIASGVIIFALILICMEPASAQRLFKERKKFGPVPIRSISLSVGFIDGPEANDLTDHLYRWALERGGDEGKNIFDEIGTSPYMKVGFERLISREIFLTAALNFSYFKTESSGGYITRTEPSIYLDMNRELSIYLFSLDLGLKYYMSKLEVKNLVPYFGGGFSAALPVVELDTELYDEGVPYTSSGGTVSETSLEEGMHAEFGLIYFITNRMSGSFEARYQMCQSKFDIHDANFDLRYRGITLALTFARHF